MDKKLLVISVILVLALIQGAYGIEVSLSGGDAGESGSVTTSIGATDEASVNGEITIDGATITPLISMSGPIPLFEQTHGVTDTTGKSASVYVRVVNAPDGLTYNSRVLPYEGTVGARPWVSAEQWLTVPKADFIKCRASASYKTLSAEVGIEENKGPITGDYVTLNGYYGKAYASDTLVYAGQTATDISASSIKIYGQSNDGNGSHSIDTQINGISGEKAIIQWLDSLSSAGNTTQTIQKAHIQGDFTSTAVAGAENITRTSNYGTEYDLSMRAINGSSPTGTLGYYVNPNMTTSSSGAIQGAVNASQSGDTVNLYDGMYKENVQIDKSLAVKGAGANRTIVDGNRSGSVFIVGQNDTNISVELSAMTIQGGSGTPLNADSVYPELYGGGILNYGRLTVKGINISGNTASNPGTLNGRGGGIYNSGILTVINSDISGNTANSYGGGIFNLGSAIVTDSTVSGNTALVSGGGIANYEAALTIKDSTVSGNDAQVGGGIWNDGSIAIIEGSTISENTANYGGGISNHNLVNQGNIYKATLKVTNSTISENTANIHGGGIENTGQLTIGGISQIMDNQATKGYGGGIYSYGILASVTFNGTEVAIKSNKAHLPSPSELSWYKGWGVYSRTGVPTTTGGFNPATQVTNNTLI